MAKAKKTTIDDLARMVQNGFSEMRGEMNNRFETVEKNISELKEGQERIELRLSNVAYRFEIIDLESRVKVLEEKIGIKPSK